MFKLSPIVDKFPVGSFVTPKENFDLGDDKFHKVDDRILVTKKNHAYFAVYHFDYDLCKKKED